MQNPHPENTPEHERFARAIRAIDAANAKDPRTETVDGEEIPVELLYSQRLTEWVFRLDPEPSEALRLAARGLHIERWTIPRETYPKGRAGYHNWRDRLREYHAERVRGILEEVGYDTATINHVAALILRSAYPDDPDARTIEDAATLLFLEHQLDDLAAKTERATMLRILRRAWRRITPRAQEIALTLSLSEEGGALVAEALSPTREGNGKPTVS